MATSRRIATAPPRNPASKIDIGLSIARYTGRAGHSVCATPSTHPPAEPGALVVRSLEAAVGDASTTPLIGAARRRLLLFPDVLPYHRFVSSYGQDEVSLG